MFGNGFSRRAIVCAHVLAARLDRKPDPKLSKQARELDDVRHWYRYHRSDGAMTYMVGALDSLEAEDVFAFFCLLAKRDGIVHDAADGKLARIPAEEPHKWAYLRYEREVEAGGAIGLADAYARVHDPAGVTIHVENSDDDPTRVEFHVQDPIANAWADRHGALDGGTWETADGEDFVYDGTYWREDLFDELRKEGFDFDFSSYGEPDERDLAIAAHAADCDVCQGDWHRAEEDFDDDAKMVAHDALTAESKTSKDEKRSGDG